MAIRIGINGFGRIGRLAFRAGIDYPDIEVRAINATVSPDYMAYMLKYDSIHGRFERDVTYTDNSLIIDGKAIPCYSDRDPANIPWAAAGVEYLADATGQFKKLAKAEVHLTAGAKKVVMTAPSDDAPMFVMGVNHESYDTSMNIVSNASCTTNSLAAVTKVIHDTFGIENLMATTIHAYTATQFLVDTPQKGGGRKGRAAALSLVPATTGAAKAMGPLFPDLKGKMDMIAVRVPTVDGSLTDANYLLKKSATVDEINAVLKKAADGPLKGIVEYCDEEIVSMDIVGNPHSGIVDALSTKVVGNLAKVMIWYDNEFGYSNRMIDLAALMGKKL